MGCGGSKSLLSAPAQQFVSMISSKPDLTKFNSSDESYKTLLQQISSPVYGGSVLLPVARKN